MLEPIHGVLYSSLFVAGVAGSLHCVDMCGPILLSFGRRVEGGEPATFGARSLDLLCLHAGRVWTYCLLGLLTGMAGGHLRLEANALGWQRPLSMLVSVLFLIAGVAALGIVPGFRLEKPRTGCGVLTVGRVRWLSWLMRDPRRGARFLLGAVMGLLPCGLVYAMLLAVATLPTPLHGALGMLVFGAGTLPALSALFLSSATLPTSLRVHGPRATGLILVAAGAFMLVRTLFVDPSMGPMHGMP